MAPQERIARAYDLYGAQLYRVAYSLLQSRESAEDAVQDAFARYLAHTGTFRDAEHEKAWLIRVTVNESKDCLKNFFRRNTVPLKELRDYAPELDPDRYRVLEAVWTLPKQYPQQYLQSFSLLEKIIKAYNPYSKLLTFLQQWPLAHNLFT